MEELSRIKFSVCLSVYKNDVAEYFYDAILSVINQSVKPAEIILVVDGPVPHLIKTTISKCESEFENFHTIWLAENKGHAFARQTGILRAKHDLIAVMDSDDLALPNRFEKQLKIFRDNKKISVLGGQIREFIDSVDNSVGERRVPLSDPEIKKYLSSRCPFNQMTVMFKKDDILSVGGYQDWYCNEDYYLWIRLYLAGKIFANIPDILVNVRVGKDMYRRRGGFKYFLSEAKLQKFMYDNKIIGFFHFNMNIFIRFFVQVLLPNTLRAFLFKNFFRKQNSDE